MKDLGNKIQIVKITFHLPELLLYPFQSLHVCLSFLHVFSLSLH